MSTIENLEGIMKDVFEMDNISLSPATTAKDIHEWDSINHVYLVVAIEKAYKIKFTTREIQAWQNVGDIVVAIENRTNK